MDKAAWTKTALLIVVLGLAGLGVAYDHWRTPSGVKIIVPDDAADASDMQAKQEARYAQAQSVDKAMPAFSLPNLKGEMIEIAPRAGGTTVYHFWASWCAPCIVELPELLARAAASPDDTRFILISLDDTVPQIERFLGRLQRAQPDLAIHPAQVVWLHDPEKHVAEQVFGTFKLPETYIAYDSEARIKAHLQGEADWRGLDLSPYMR